MARRQDVNAQVHRPSDLSRGLLGCMMWLAVSAATAAPALATDTNDDLICPVDTADVGLTSRLRAMSLDLRGILPTDAEYAAFDGLEGDEAAALEAQIVDDWLESPEFMARVIKQHNALLWPNLEPIEFSTRRVAADSRGIFARNDGQVQEIYRGVRGATCLDEPARFDDEGGILATTVDGARREGWVTVRPFWAPETEVRICAFDAQVRLTSEDGADCSTEAGSGRRGCGCGPNLQWCLRTEDQNRIRSAMVEDMNRRVTAVIDEDDSYLEILTGRRAFVNGPLAHFWRHLTKLSRFVRMEPGMIGVDALPDDLPFAAIGDWREIQLDAGHAGVLTSPAFLLRFQSNRARANRFYNAFLCQPFQPPSSGIELVAGAISEPDLQERAGCNYCHAVLEPAAAYWGRFTEYGAGALSPTFFPAVRDDCRRCALTGSGCSDECNRYYVTRAQNEDEREWLGTFRPYVYRRPEHVRNIEAGPRLLALSAAVDGRLQRCVARTTVQWLTGVTLADTDPALTELAWAFESSSFNYRDLVRRVVLGDVYRRVR